MTMSRSKVCNGLLLALSFLMVGWVIVQRQELATLAKKRQQLLEQEAAAAESTKPVPEFPSANSATPSEELLRLRSQIGQLNSRLRELNQVQTEHARLLAETGKRGTNAYVRKSQARMAGFATPSDTLETFLWSLHNRDLPTLLQCFTPEAAEFVKVASDKERSSTDFFQAAEGFLGLGVISQEQQPDGLLRVDAQVVPDLPPVHLVLRQLNGQWKLAGPP